MNLRALLAPILGLLLPIGLSAQVLPGSVIDRVAAVVGDEIILESDVDNQVNYLIINGEKDDGSLRCQVLESLIISKLLLNKAQQDSVEVGEDQVSQEIDRRMEVLLNKIDRTQFEAIYGKPVDQFREDMREEIRNEMLVERQRGILLDESDITPKEVREFFKSLPKDSLGYLGAEVEINHIVIAPPPSDASRERAINTLKELRRKVMEENADFGDLASRYTDEPGGRARKGDLGWFGRGMMVPEFEEIAFQLRPGEISEPLRTEFGIHIIKLYERRGERVHAAHILKRLEPGSNGDAEAIDSLNAILALIRSDSLSFEEAAIEYSGDRQTKHCGGCISNPQTGELRIPLDALDPDLYFQVERMKEGEVSAPMEYLQPDGSRVFHIVYLKKKIPPHAPNLKDDYQKIHNAALQNRQAVAFDNWIRSAKKNVYLDIKPTECSEALKYWLQE
jgi:peptidyl-prolyl cis-trans isomerase SurA